MRIDGQEISSINTLKTWYDNNCISAIVLTGEDDNGHKEYRLDCKEINGMIGEFIFKAVKKRKHTYLEIDWDATDEMRGRVGQ